MESALMNRIVFGCGRLTGGASEREALALVHQCLDAGLRIFDTAPSYGMGTAEGVVGKALKGREDCVIVTKLGSAPQSPSGCARWPARPSAACARRPRAGAKALCRSAMPRRPPAPPGTSSACATGSTVRAGCWGG
jgi:aryl-alcohol dehydrogenase-like predicted oxidoreductase